MSNVKKHHHKSAYKLNNNTTTTSLGQTGKLTDSTLNRINHSTSFVIASSPSSSSTAAGLDTCPKCGRNICEHTSVADVINLPNSISQDFSTYSSDSSLIKQLLSESTSSTGTIRSSVNYYNKPNQPTKDDYETINSQSSLVKLNPTSLMFSQLLTQMNKQSTTTTTNSAAMSNYITFNVLRPVSCQYVLDTETTDKLLKDFFESSSNHSKSRPISSNKSEKTTQTVETDVIGADEVVVAPTPKRVGAKKNKFSHFRIFSSHHKNTTSSSSSTSDGGNNNKPAILRSTTHAFVNCLTSSSSSSSASSSCEEIARRAAVAAAAGGVNSNTNDSKRVVVAAGKKIYSSTSSSSATHSSTSGVQSGGSSSSGDEQKLSVNSKQVGLK